MKKKSLEHQFKDALKKANTEIKEQMKIAEKAIDKAVEISEKYGIPFHGYSFLTQSYKPSSFEEKWSDFPEEFIEELIVPEYVGWQHSDIC